jgi:hypothetical protein
MCNVKDKDGYHIGKEHCPKSCDRCEKYDDDKHYDNDWVGGHFCTWGPDYDCFDGGWPRCCSSNNHVNCSNKQPECEKYDYCEDDQYYRYEGYGSKVRKEMN